MLRVPYVPSDIDSWAVRFWETLLARLFTGEPDTVLNSELTYTAILFPVLLGPGRAC